MSVEKLVKTVRGMKLPPGYNQDVLTEAADALERLEAENARLREALDETTEFARMFVADFETDFVLNGVIVDSPNSLWSPLEAVYRNAQEAYRLGCAALSEQEQG